MTIRAVLTLALSLCLAACCEQGAQKPKQGISIGSLWPKKAQAPVAGEVTPLPAAPIETSPLVPMPAERWQMPVAEPERRHEYVALTPRSDPRKAEKAKPKKKQKQVAPKKPQAAPAKVAVQPKNGASAPVDIKPKWNLPWSCAEIRLGAMFMTRKQMRARGEAEGIVLTKQQEKLAEDCLDGKPVG